jgi:tRNA threonylcarbamoyladenosine biosynthesis protein TsaE
VTAPTDRELVVPTAEDMRELGAVVGRAGAGGDVIVLAGDLGAGKTTFTQGLAVGLGVVERVTSPTFVIARAHANPTGGPDLVHVDAYRVGSALELDDLDLDADLATSVVVIEWGTGLAEGLSTERLDVRITRSDDEDDDVRTVWLSAHGARWQEIVRGADVARWTR